MSDLWRIISRDILLFTSINLSLELNSCLTHLNDIKTSLPFFSWHLFLICAYLSPQLATSRNDSIQFNPIEYSCHGSISIELWQHMIYFLIAHAKISSKSHFSIPASFPWFMDVFPSFPSFLHFSVCFYFWDADLSMNQVLSLSMCLYSFAHDI